MSAQAVLQFSPDQAAQRGQACQLSLTRNMVTCSGHVSQLRLQPMQWFVTLHGCSLHNSLTLTAILVYIAQDCHNAACRSTTPTWVTATS